MVILWLAAGLILVGSFMAGGDWTPLALCLLLVGGAIVVAVAAGAAW